jgi:hypothetical protein
MASGLMADRAGTARRNSALYASVERRTRCNRRYTHAD